MRFSFLIIFLLFSLPIFAQNNFKLTGEVKNPTERKVLITLYRNWVSDEEEYEIQLDKNNQFVFETNLADLAYIDFYYGDSGFHFWVIEPQDHISLKINTKDFWKSLMPTGLGAKKFEYYIKEYQQNEEKRDIQKDLDKWRELPVEAFFAKIDAEQTKQIALLDSYKNSISNNFYELRKADIIGALQNHKVESLFDDSFKSWSETHMKSKIKFETLQASSQAKSLEFGNTYLNLVELFTTRAAESRRSDLSKTEIYEVIKSFFVRDYIGRDLCERLLANFLKNSIELDGLTEEMVSLIKNYQEFAENKEFVNYFMQKINFLKTLSAGSPAKNFVLKDINGNDVSLESLKGKVVHLDFWASWCGPCLYDMKLMEKIKEEFKNQDDLVFVHISLDEEAEWKEASQQNQIKGLNLKADAAQQVVKNFGVNGIPAYFLIDKNGNFAVSQVADPSLEDGKKLIEQLKNALSQ